MDFALQIVHPLAKIFTEIAQRCWIDQYAFALHRRNNRDQRPLDRFVEGRHAFLDEARFQQPVQPEGYVSILCCVVAGSLQRDIVKSYLILAGAGDVLEADAVMVEMQFCQFVHAVPIAPAIEHE